MMQEVASSGSQNDLIEESRIYKSKDLDNEISYINGEQPVEAYNGESKGGESEDEQPGKSLMQFTTELMAKTKEKSKNRDAYQIEFTQMMNQSRRQLNKHVTNHHRFMAEADILLHNEDLKVNE